MMKHETRWADAIRLSEVQEGMLLFFAGLRDEPCGQPKTTQSLVARSLLERDSGSSRYRITRLGQEVATRLGQEAVARGLGT